MRIALPLLAIAFFASIALAQAPVTLMIEDFEADTPWDGVTIDDADARVGERSGLWRVSEIAGVFNREVPNDWSGFDRLVLWMHSEVANEQTLTFVADSLNPDSEGWDYYYHHMVVDWEGWRLISLSLEDDMRSARNPAGWHSINYLAIRASGWHNMPLDDTVIRLDGVKLVRDPISVDDLGYAGQSVADRYSVVHRFAITNRSDQPASFPLAVEGDFTIFEPELPADHTPLIAPGEQAEVEVALSIDTAALGQVEPLTMEQGLLTISPPDDDGGLPPVIAPISAAVPLPDLERPSLFATRDTIERAKQRAERYDWARERLDAIVAAGEQALELEVAVPEEGGQWSHHYVCEDCGVRLRTQSPTEHVCTRCEKVHTGWPWDQVVIAREHHRLTRAVQDLGLAYAFTDDLRYAEKAREILLAYGERYRSFPLQDSRGGQGQSAGRLYAQTLDESVNVIGVAWGYDLIWDSGVFSDEDREIIENGYLRAVVEVIRRNDRNISNWQSWHNAGIAAIGFCLRDAELASLAINGPSGLRYQLRNSVLSDGFWYEGAVDYHYYALNALRYTVEAAWHSGIDFYGDEVYRSLYETPLLYVYPDLTYPAVNDSNRSSIAGRHAMYEIAHARFGDELFVSVAERGNRNSLEALLWGVDELPPAPALAQSSHSFDGVGATVLRHGTGEDQTYVHMAWGPHGGGHGHPDKLSMILWALNTELAPDPGRLAYGASLHHTWYKQTVSHSTVALDERSQRPAEGRLLAFHDGEIARIARAEVDTAYPGVMMRRTLILADDYLIDLFDLDAGEPRVADWVYHNIGEHAPHFDTTALDGSLGEDDGYQHITDVRTAALDGNWRTDFEMEGTGRVRLTMLGEEGTRVYLGSGLTGRGIEPIPSLVVRRETDATAWLSAIEWREPGAEFAVSGIEVIPVTVDGAELASDAGFAVRIERTDGYDVLMIAPGVEGEKLVEGIATEGHLCFFRVRDGQVVGLEQMHLEE